MLTFHLVAYVILSLFLVYIIYENWFKQSILIETIAVFGSLGIVFLSIHYLNNNEECPEFGYINLIIYYAFSIAMLVSYILKWDTPLRSCYKIPASIFFFIVPTVNILFHKI